MAHTHEQTALVKRLGFKDPDKSEPLHDLACQYVAQSEVGAAIGGLFGSIDNPWIFKSSKMEVPLKPKTATGFLDAELVFHHTPHKGEPRTMFGDSVYYICGHQDDCTAVRKTVLQRHRDGDDVQWCEAKACVEVKINPLASGDILRQINFYRQYRYGAKWILAAAFAITPDLEKVLRDADIMPIQLSEKFAEFVERQRTLRAGPSTVKTI